MRKYIVICGLNSVKYEFTELDSAVKCFADFVEKNVKVSLMMLETRVLGSYLLY